MHPSIRGLISALALGAASGVPHGALAQAAGTTATQPEPPGTPLVSPSDKPLLGGIAPLSASGQNTLTIAPGTIPPLSIGLKRRTAPQGEPPAR